MKKLLLMIAVLGISSNPSVLTQVQEFTSKLLQSQPLSNDWKNEVQAMILKLRDASSFSRHRVK